LFGGADRRRRCGDQNIDLELQEFVDEGRDPVSLSFDVTIFDHDVLSVDVT
jgi:hypothetical protein